jgi:predicted esterase
VEAPKGLTPNYANRLERYSGPIFLSHGEEDQVWTVECTRRLEARLRASGGDPEVHTLLRRRGASRQM